MEFIVFHPPSHGFLCFALYGNQWLCALKWQIPEAHSWSTDFVGLRKDPGNTVLRHMQVILIKSEYIGMWPNHWDLNNFPGSSDMQTRLRIAVIEQHLPTWMGMQITWASCRKVPEWSPNSAFLPTSQGYWHCWSMKNAALILCHTALWLPLVGKYSRTYLGYDLQPSLPGLEVDKTSQEALLIIEGWWDVISQLKFEKHFF